MASSKQPKEIGIKLEKFKMEWIANNKIIVMIGSRGRGKSTILLDYLYHNQDVPFVTCVSPTDNFNHTFTPHVPSRFIYARYTPHLTENFLMRQKGLKAKKMEAQMGVGDGRYANVDCRGMLIMDDCLADNKGWKSDETLKWIFFNGRHADITFILTMQYQVGIPPEYRTNIDWVFLCKENKRIERQKLWKYYAGIFPKFEMFEQIFMKCTTDKKCMVINQLAESEVLEEQVFWFKAKLRPNFRICYDEFWENNNEYLKQRLAVKDRSGHGGGHGAKAGEGDDYYKYVDRGKVHYNLKMDEKTAYGKNYG